MNFTINQETGGVTSHIYSYENPFYVGVQKAQGNQTSHPILHVLLIFDFRSNKKRVYVKCM